MGNPWSWGSSLTEIILGANARQARQKLAKNLTTTSLSSLASIKLLCREQNAGGTRAQKYTRRICHAWWEKQRESEIARKCILLCPFFALTSIVLQIWFGKHLYQRVLAWTTKQIVVFVFLVAVVEEPVGLELGLVAWLLMVVQLPLTLTAHSGLVAVVVVLVLEIVAMPSWDHIADESWIKKTTHFVSVVRFVVVRLYTPSRSRDNLPYNSCRRCHDPYHKERLSLS